MRVSILFGLLWISGCGGSGSGADALAPDRSDAAPTDTATHDGASADAASGCDHTGFAWAYSGAKADAQRLAYSAIDNLAGDPTDVIAVERYYGAGASRGGGQLVSLHAESYADCSTCVLVFHGCQLGPTIYEPGTCDHTFLARAGTVELTIEETAGGELLGFLHDVELAEVTIDPSTYATTVIPGGQTWCIPLYKFEADPISAWE
jgi:hypothetical protein